MLRPLTLLLALTSLLVACGGEEEAADPANGTETSTVSTDGGGASDGGPASGTTGGQSGQAGGTGAQPGGADQSADGADAQAATHPHPEWAELEIATDNLVSAIEPEAYVTEIREALKHHGTREDPIPVTTDFLGGWEFDESQDDPFPPHVRAIDGKYVMVKGFMLPDIDFEGITEFHLVRSLWGCCFGAPPRLNEMIRVHTPDDTGMRYTYNTLEIIGKMTVKFETVDGLIEDPYRLQAESVVEGDFDDPLAPEGATPDQMGDFLPEMEF